jgi:hypothetical protein
MLDSRGGYGVGPFRTAAAARTWERMWEARHEIFGMHDLIASAAYIVIKAAEDRGVQGR